MKATTVDGAEANEFTNLVNRFVARHEGHTVSVDRAARTLYCEECRRVAYLAERRNTQDWVREEW